MRLAIYPHEVQDFVPLLYSAQEVDYFDEGLPEEEPELPHQPIPQYHIQQREETPVKEPGTSPDHIIYGPPGTRRDSILALSFKAPDFIPKVNRKMEDKWCERTFAALAGLVPGSNPTKAQFKKFTKAFDIEWDGLKEKDMYPILVRKPSSFRPLPLPVASSPYLTFHLPNSVPHLTSFYLLLRPTAVSRTSLTGARTTSLTCDRISSCTRRPLGLVQPTRSAKPKCLDNLRNARNTWLGVLGDG